MAIPGVCNSRQYYLVPAFLWMFLVPFLHLASRAKSVAGPVYPMLQIAIWFTGHLGTLLVLLALERVPFLGSYVFVVEGFGSLHI